MKVALTPLDFLERARRLFGPLEAVVDGDRRITYTELASRAHRLAHALRRDLGVVAGDRVAYLCGNTLELLEAYYGVLLAGAVLTPLNVRLAPAELSAIVDDCTPALIVVHPLLADAAVGLSPGERLDLDDGYETLLAAQTKALFEPDAFDEDDVCELFYTSGTTGLSKGAMLTHRNLATHAVDSALTLGMHHRDTQLHTIPLFHVNGWGTPHYVTALGAKHVMIERFDAGEILRLIEAEGVTRASIVPTMGSSLLAHPSFAERDLSSLTQVTVGGAPASPTLIAELEDALGCEVVCGYGMTEASPQMTKAFTRRDHDALSPGEQRRRKATTGHPMIGVDLKVLDGDDIEVAWDGATPGEICLRSNHVMAGYWNLPDDTDLALRGGWLRTGDIAVVDGEGYVTIVDRRKDIIVSGGENVSSVEVENRLCAHPSVLEVAVVGMPDATWGEVPCAFVTLRPGSPAVSPDDLVAWVRAALAGFKTPKRVELVDELPKSGTGKVLKSELRERARGMG
ncbi:MAG TPA: long-chain-fatty-acid--CoA ligase [Acidimicrobiales bacterium]|nr:long-chain-fatty-acid--CoA ligase [Acidimicrobiales bacterium]